MSDALPAFLVDPPWEREARAYRAAAEAERSKDAPLVPGLEPPAEQSVIWRPGEREEWLAIRPEWRFTNTKENGLLDSEGWEGVVQAYEAGKVAWPPSQATMFCGAPEELVRPLLPEWRPSLPRYCTHDVTRIAARFELDARHVVIANAKADTSRFGPMLAPYLDVELARMMADWFVRLKSARRIARAWLLRHGTAAVPFLVPDALAKRRVPREKATAAL